MTSQEYTRIVQQYANDLYRLILSYCRNIHDAEDLLQNVFEKLLKERKHFQDEEYLKRWLIIVAVNECRNLFRSAWRKKLVSFEEWTPESACFTPEDSELLVAVRELPPKYRIVIHLHYYAGYSEKEIAEILKIPLSTVKTRVRRGKKRLRERMEEL